MKCPGCQSNDTKKFLQLPRDPKILSSWGVPSSGQTIYYCKQCSLQFTDRIISEEEEEAMYDQNYQEMMTGGKSAEELKSGVHEQSQLRFELVKKFVPRGDLLDVGCSTGIFLEKAAQNGFSVYGLDTSEYACKAARIRLGLGEDRIIHSTIANATILGEKKFDVITAWDVIEHCAAPREDLERMVQALNPGGICVLRTPNTSSIFFQSALAINRISFGKLKFPLLSLYHSDHLVFFNPKSLHRLLNQMGLMKVHMESEPLLWKRFKYCECRRGPFVNAGIGSLYFLGRAFGSGHGLIVVASKS